jgi:hypothetical protein
MEGGRLVAPFDPTNPVSPFVERPAKGSLNASDLTAGFIALVGGGSSGKLSEEALLKRIRIFYPDATKEEAAFLMPADGRPFDIEYARTLLCVPLGPSFDPVAEAMRAFTTVAPVPLSIAAAAAAAAATAHTTHTHFTPPASSSTHHHHHHRQPLELSVTALRRISGSLLGEKGLSCAEDGIDNNKSRHGLSNSEIEKRLETLWDVDGDGRLGLEDVRAALGRERAARATATTATTTTATTTTMQST